MTLAFVWGHRFVWFGIGIWWMNSSGGGRVGVVAVAWGVGPPQPLWIRWCGERKGARAPLP